MPEEQEWFNEILTEYKDVLNRKEFNINKQLIGIFINNIKKLANRINPASMDVNLIDLKDQPFYELVMSKNINEAKLITGNIKHFPIKPFIMTPSEFINKYF